MVEALLSRIGRWWNRLMGRDSTLAPSRRAIAAPSGVTTERAPEYSPDTDGVTLPRGEEMARSNRPRADSDEAAVAPVTLPADTLPAIAPGDGRSNDEQCLIEVLGVESLAESRVERASGPRAEADPTVRERTLNELNSLRQIPALQSLAQGFLRAMSRQEVSVTEVIASIEKDSALCVRVLRMANSVLVSPEQRIDDLDTAVQMLGVKRVRHAAQALFTLRDANRVAEGFDWRHLWIHALGTAAIAEELEKQLRANDDSQVHLAALLHDVGKIVLSTIAPDAYREVLLIAWNENGRLEELERERLGVDHREAGVLFAQHNQLPPVVLAAIAHHNRPEEATSYRFEVALVAIANYLSKAHGVGFSGARLDERDGEFADLSAWEIVTETCGFRPDVDLLEAEMTGFISALRADLRMLREES